MVRIIKVINKSNIKIYGVYVILCSKKLHEIHNVDQRNAKMTKKMSKEINI